MYHSNKAFSQEYWVVEWFISHLVISMNYHLLFSAKVKFKILRNKTHKSGRETSPTYYYSILMDLPALLIQQEIPKHVFDFEKFFVQEIIEVCLYNCSP